MSTGLLRRAAGVCLALAASLAVATGDDPRAIRMEVDTPRDVGYVIGDTITLVARLELGAAWHLDERALPAAGRVDAWLEQRAPVLRPHGSGIDITFTWQLINAPDETRALIVPRQTLQIADAERRVPLFVPEWSFTAAPIVPAAQRGAAARFNLRPERLPPTLAIEPDVWRLVALLAGLGAVLGRIAWLRWGAPWRAGRARPFAHALRRLERLRGGSWDEARQREAFRVMHAALDRAAGCTVLPSTVEQLYRAQPSLAALREPLAEWLAESRRLFFGADAAGPRLTLAALMQLCRACRDIERASA